MKISLIIATLLILPISAALAAEADIVDVAVKRNSDKSYSFSVTVAHADSGWDHYANKWELLAPDGTVLATRTLHHPHVNEQPFTRSLSGVKIPPGISELTVRAHDSVHQYGGKTMTLKLP